MRSATFVCFECRTTERVPVSRLSKTCRKCRKPAESVFYKFPIPRRTDDRGWEELLRKVRPFNRAARERALVYYRTEQARLEKLIHTTPSKARAFATRLKAARKAITQWQSFHVV